MKFLKNKAAWTRWARKLDKSQELKFEEPKEFPCFAATSVASYGYEEDYAWYLYASDVARMMQQLKHEFQTAHL